MTSSCKTSHIKVSDDVSGTCIQCFTHTYAHTYTHICAHIRTHINIRAHTHTHIRTHAHTHTHTYAQTYTHTHTQIRTHIRTNIRTHIRTHIPTHIRTHAHTLDAYLATFARSYTIMNSCSFIRTDATLSERVGYGSCWHGSGSSGVRVGVTGLKFVRGSCGDASSSGDAVVLGCLDLCGSRTPLDL